MTASRAARLSASRLSIDGGQSGTRFRLRRADGSADERTAGPIFTDRPILPQVAAYAESVLAAWGAQADDVGAGLSGLTVEETEKDALQAIADRLGARTVSVVHDSVSGYLGANALADGAVVAVGTGVVTLGVTAAATHRVDGWGYLFGDVGSAFWIGRAGFEAAMRAFDGRGEPTVLLDAVRDLFGDPAGLYMTVQANPERVRVVGAFAQTVAAAADAGDPAADAIITAAADELAISTAAGLHGAGIPSGTVARVSWVGRVLTENRMLRDRFTASLAARHPGAEVAAPLGDPLDGVELLGQVPAGHALRAVIATSA